MVDGRDHRIPWERLATAYAESSEGRTYRLLAHGWFLFLERLLLVAAIGAASRLTAKDPAASIPLGVVATISAWLFVSWIINYWLDFAWSILRILWPDTIKPMSSALIIWGYVASIGVVIVGAIFLNRVLLALVPLALPKP